MKKKKLPPGIKKREPISMTSLKEEEPRAEIAQKFIGQKFQRNMMGKKKTLVVLGITDDLQHYIVGVLRYASRPIQGTNNLMLLLKIEFNDLPKVLENPDIMNIEGLTKSEEESSSKPVTADLGVSF